MKRKAEAMGSYVTCTDTGSQLAAAVRSSDKLRIKDALVEAIGAPSSFTLEEINGLRAAADLLAADVMKHAAVRMCAEDQNSLCHSFGGQLLMFAHCFVPVEIAGIVFGFSRSPFPFAGVCKEWRRLSMLPALWSRLKLWRKINKTADFLEFLRRPQFASLKDVCLPHGMLVSNKLFSGMTYNIFEPIFLTLTPPPPSPPSPEGMLEICPHITSLNFSGTS
jgi:hypothetical protein